jgi:hypothetical protein
MAGFADLVRDLVAVADDLTSTLQEDVSHYAFANATTNDYNEIDYGTSPTLRKALVERGVTLRKSVEGDITSIKATKITFLRPVAVDPKDKFVLADGTTGRPVNLKGLDNPDIRQPYLVEVFIDG